MATTFQIRKIHALKNVIGMDDDLYRDMLISFDVTSSKDLTFTEAAIFVDIFDNLHQMAKLIDEVKPKEVMLSELFKTKLKIEDELEQELEMAKG